MSKQPAAARRARPRRPPATLWACTGLPLWARVGLFAQAHHGVRLGPGELLAQVDPGGSRSVLSHAIARAIAEGLIAHDSTARCLYSLVRRGDGR